MKYNLKIQENEDMKKHTTFKIGGNAKFFIIPKNVQQILESIKFAKSKNLPYFILGNGSNLLVDDKGYNGVIISLKELNKISLEKQGQNAFVCVEAGVNLFRLNQFLANNSISGIEWSYGIPASFGGSVKMNAGAFEKCVGDFLCEITVLKNGKIKKIKKINFSYRNSFLTDEIILSGKLKLKEGEKDEIKAKMSSFLTKRRQTQPYDLPSAGSIFKRNNFLPAKIIDDFGLKGLILGEAQISKKHAGFIVNLGNATSKDVLKLIHIIKILAKEEGYEFNEEIIHLK